MKLRRLCKWISSIDVRDCPAMYIADPPSEMVVQGRHLDDETTSQLLNRADNEGGLAIPTETVVRAVGLLLAEYGRPDLHSEIESFLAERAEWT